MKRKSAPPALVTVRPPKKRGILRKAARVGATLVAARVAAARALQGKRGEEAGVRTNAELDGDMLERFATPDEAGRMLLMQAAEAMRLSARSYVRMLRVARTIADLSHSEQIGRVHVAEALSYRRQAPRA